jgi:hypothetical protein
MLVSCQARKRLFGCPVQFLIESRRNELRVLKYKPGDKLSLTSDGFARLAAAFFAGIERKYVATWRQMPPVPAVGAVNSTM